MEKLFQKELESLVKNAEKNIDLIPIAMQNAFDLGYDCGKKGKWTKKQRGSLHVYCDDVAVALNEHGLTPEEMLKRMRELGGIEIDWNLYMIKEIYKKVLKKRTGKGSTEDQETHEPQGMHEHLVRFLAKVVPEIGYIDWPHEEVPDPPEPDYPTENNDPDQVPF